MLKEHSYPWSKKSLILVILPLFFVVLSFVFLKQVNKFYIYGPDCEYAYLMNGTNLAGGHMEIGHYDHPGTPVQCFAAAVIYLKHSIAGTQSVYQDVLLHPEEYLFTCSIILILLLGMVTYFSGRMVYRHTDNLGLALLFQLTPLNREFIPQGALLHPESFIIIGGTFFAAYIFTHIFLPQLSYDRSSTRATLISGVFTGLLIATKISCIPLIAFMLFVLASNRQRLIYLATAVASFIAFIIPVLFKLDQFFAWIHKLIYHEGLYGKGKTGILDTREFLMHIHELLIREFTYTSIYLLITIAFFTIIIAKTKKQPVNNVYSRFITGLWLSITLLMLMVAKHYAFRYLIPAQVFFPLGIVVSYYIISPYFESDFYKKHKKQFLYCTSLPFLVILIPLSFIYSFDSNHRKSITDTRAFLHSQRHTPVIVTSLHGAVYVEPSLYFGIAYAGDVSSDYFHFIKQYYPDTYLFGEASHELKNWDKKVVPPEIFSKNSRVFVYYKDCDTAYEDSLLRSICTWNDIKLGTSKLIYSNTETKEDIYQVKADTALAARLLENYSITYCNLEQLTDDRSKFVATDKSSFLLKASQVDHTQHHSGNNSLLANKQHPYGLDLEFPVKPNYLIDAKVWVKNTDRHGYVTLKGTDDSFMDEGQVIIRTDSNGWQQIECRTVIPADYKPNKALFYVFYDGQNQAWFDDVCIKVFPLQKYNNTAIKCNMENTTDDKAFFTSIDGHYKLGDAKQVSQAEHFSGKNSIQLDGKHPYGMDMLLHIEPGDSLSATVWRKASDSLGDIVFSSRNDNAFYSGKRIVIDPGKNGWQQILCTARIPDNYADSVVKAYLYYPGKKQAWFDDMEIKIFPPPPVITDISSDLEKTAKDTSVFASSNAAYTFQKARLVNHIEHHSGSSSVKLDAKHPFALDVTLKVHGGDSVTATIWRKCADDTGVIVFTCDDAKYFYLSKAEVVATAPGGWKQIQCSGKLPVDYKYPTLNFYMYYPGKREVYLDDVEIKVFSKTKPISK